MSERPECRRTRAVIAELVLGVAVGEDRAPALQHLEWCAECRREVADLDQVVDELMLLAPAREPPVGFESRVVAALGGQKPKPRRWRRVLGYAVAASVAAAATGAGTYLATEGDRRVADQVRLALERADGRYFGVEFLHQGGGAPVGHVFVYRGMPSWIFVVVSPDRTGSFDVEVVTRDGDELAAGAIDLSAGRNGAGIVLPVDLAAVETIRLIPEGGGRPLEAHVPAPGGG